MTSDAHPETRILGSLRSADGRGDADVRWNELQPAYQDLAANVGQAWPLPGQC